MKKKIILFLDIDGVLNACGNPEKGEERTKERFDGFVGICPKRVALLNEVIDRTGAEVVMSSTWRLGNEAHWNKVLNYLKQQGFKGNVIDRTPSSSSGFRGGEVDDWLSKNAEMFPDIHHAIVDDDHDFYEDQPLVRTDGRKGLTKVEVEQLVKLLTPEPKIEWPTSKIDMKQ